MWGAFAMLAIVTACGRIGFDPNGGVGGDGGGEDGGDAGGPMGTITNPTGIAGEQFGHQVVMSADGGTLVVTARAADATVVDGGVAYVFVAGDTGWVLGATLEPAVRDINDQFGLNVAISANGTTIVVTSTNEDGGGTDTSGDPTTDSVIDSGAAWVFTGSGDSWSQQAYLKSGISSPDDSFGSCAGLSANGNVLVVGERNEDAGATDSGAVNIFRRAGTVWTFDRKLAAVPLRALDELGTACAISSDGMTIAAAAATYMNQTGAVIVFHDEGAWTQTLLVPAMAGLNDGVGDGVAMSATGNLIVAGANGFDDPATDSGAVFAFTLEGTTWTEGPMLAAPDAQADDTLGYNLAIARGGDEILVAAEGADRGGAADSGAVYKFMRSGSTWSSAGQMTAPVPAANQVFGDSIATSADGSVFAIGAPGDDDGRGAVYVFRN